MVRIWNFFIGLREAIVLFVCVLASALLMFTSENDPDIPLRNAAFKMIGTFGGLIHDFQSYFDLREINTELRAENVSLAYQNLQLREALLENLRLRKLLEFKEKSGLSLIPAEVTGQNPQEIFNSLILDSGSDHSIYKDQAVLTADGLVGKIARSEPQFAVCQILLDRNSRVSAKVQRNRELGVVAWDGGKRLKLLYITKTIKILPGDVIITSGLSSIYPENIKIGIVIDVSLDQPGLFQDITIQPGVNFNRLEEVFVVKKQDSTHAR